MKNSLLFILALIANISIAQRTFVKGYFRKDGTYVNSHTRGYHSGSNLTYSSNTRTNNDEPLAILESNTKIHSNGNFENKKEVFHYKGRYANIDFIQSNLKIVESSKLDSTSIALPIYFSVLRYNGKIIDICPVSKSLTNYDYDFDLGTLYHKINRNQISAEHIVELISSCGFNLVGNEVRLFMPISSHKSMVDKINKTVFLKHTSEVIHLD